MDVAHCARGTDVVKEAVEVVEWLIVEDRHCSEAGKGEVRFAWKCSDVEYLSGFERGQKGATIFVPQQNWKKRLETSSKTEKRMS